MGEIRQPSPVLLIIAAFAQKEESLAWGRERAMAEFGPIWRESPTFYFNEFTHYYDKEMGPVLPKRFWAFEKLIDMGQLATIKIKTNRWEEELAEMNDSAVPRPLNLDPGYIDLGKLILASTKDHSHRIYLGEGIFAETTLYFSQKEWKTLPWTYPDYQSEGYQRFFSECRGHLHEWRKQYVSGVDAPTRRGDLPAPTTD